MARRLQRIPDYFTEEEAVALVDAAPSYQTRMAFRVMLKTGLRVSEALALRRVDLRLDQDPPIIVVRADSPGNKARKGREVPVPADLLESLRDLALFHGKDRHRPMLDLSRQRIGQVMKDAARPGQALTRPGPTPTPSGTPTAVTACCGASRFRCCRSGWGTPRWWTPSAMWSWPGRTTNGWPGCEPYLLAALPKLNNPTSVRWPKTPVCGPFVERRESDAHLLGSRLSQVSQHDNGGHQPGRRLGEGPRHQLRCLRPAWRPKESSACRRGWPGAQRISQVNALVRQFTQIQAEGKAGGQQQPDLGDQAVIAKGDVDAVGVLKR